VQGVGFREATVRRAREIGVTGWVRNSDDGSVLVHAEGDKRALGELTAFLGEGPPQARVAQVGTEKVAVEGHEQFAIRGVSAGTFTIQERGPVARHFALHLEVVTKIRSWRVPKGPSLDPSVKRLAVELDDEPAVDASFEGTIDTGRAIVWDRGDYEQGGRVAWPEALARGHAVFVLHGNKLCGGFALQRTRPGPGAQWLLIKRRDEDARPGSDIVARRPGSVLSGRTLDEIPG
jgi:DNA ligase D-like protein (predicted 3'-phosphoesterase)